MQMTPHSLSDSRFWSIANYWFSQFHLISPQAILHRLFGAGALLIAALMVWMVTFLVLKGWAYLGRRRHTPTWYREPPNDNSGLVVIVHGWLGGTRSMREIAGVIETMKEYAGFGIFLWAFNGERFSNEDPEGIAHDLRTCIDELHEMCHGEVVLIGHSIGGLLVRRAYLEGMDESRSWSRLVSRIILLAAPNRGTRAIDRSKFLFLSDVIARSCGVAKLIQGVYRGAPFVVNLRIDWIRRFQSMRNPPFVAQLIGAKDSKVSVLDSQDVVQFPSAKQKILHNSNHESIIRSRESGADLREILRTPLEQHEHPPEDDNSVFKVLIAHGIRDYGDTFKEIAEVLSARGKRLNLAVVSDPSRYRYFSALEFVLPLARRAKMYDFADRYAQLLAEAPVHARINFVGHSFGTYLMLKSTDDYRAMEFDRAYLAGTVLHEDFFLARDLLGSRVKCLRNDIATSDWPVGILCRALDGLWLARDIGTAGFNGFTGIAQSERHVEIRYFNGGHGIALHPLNRPNIADWLFQDHGAPKFGVLDVKRELGGEKLVVTERAPFWIFFSKIAPSAVLVVFALIGLLLAAGERPGLVVCELLVVAWLLRII
jgi:pimeloyl-ACP methyl ester carboxylesterase